MGSVACAAETAATQPAEFCEEEPPMIRREGRLDHPHLETGTRGHERRGSVTVRNWERPVLVAAVIVILMLGVIAGMNGLIALFP